MLDAGGGQLTLQTSAMSNSATFASSDTGTLSINGITVTQSSGANITAGTNSFVTLTNSTIVGGQLNSTGNGLFTANGTNTLNNLISNATINVPNDQELNVVGNLTDNGLITVNPTSQGNYTILSFNGGILSGSGTVALNSPSSAAQLNGTLIQASPHTIQGFGEINAALTNSGTVNASVKGQTLFVLANATNSATFQATNGGTLAINSVTVTQGSAGQITATGSPGTTSLININSSTINGGSINVGANATVTATGASAIGGVTVTGGPLVLAPSSTMSASGANSLPQITGSGALNVTSGKTQLVSGGGTSTLAGLTIATSAALDITSNNLVINYSSDPAATIRGYLQTAYNGGVWTGAGLTSSVVASQITYAIAHPGSGVYGIGYVDGGKDTNQAANALVKAVGNQIVYTPALVGDANLDGNVTFIDLGIVAQNLGGTNSDWEHGDFNYDGSVNFLDIGLLAQNLNKTTLNTPLGELIPDPTPALTAQWNLAVAEIQSNLTQPADLPEPGMISLLALGGAGLLARRRRKYSRL